MNDSSSTKELSEIERLRKENIELARTNDFLRITLRSYRHQIEMLRKEKEKVKKYEVLLKHVHS